MKFNRKFTPPSKKLLHISKIIFFNIILLTIFVGISEIVIYKYYSGLFEELEKPFCHKYKYSDVIPVYMQSLESYFNGKQNYGRIPDGIEYNNKMPIILFGCSFAYGQYLDYTQTLSYKLAHRLKRPVYNRAISATGVQHMYYQVDSESLYETIPNTDTILYVFIPDHYRRLMVNYFDVSVDKINIHYAIKDSKLKIDDYKNELKNIFKSLYLVKFINCFYVDKYVNNEKNWEKITDNTLLYFIETRKKLETRFNKKLNFIVLIYENDPYNYSNILSEKLKKEGFVVVWAYDLVGVDLDLEDYKMKDNGHPKEYAWDLLVPPLIEKLNL